MNSEIIPVKTISLSLEWLHQYGELKMCFFGKP